MTAIALRMLLEQPSRTIITIIGIAFLFFLSAAQVGLLVGWCNTCSAIIRNANADVWVMAEKAPCFDYGTPIPGHRIPQVRSVPGVAWAEGFFMAWNTWQRRDGAQVNVEVVGLDDHCVGGPWDMRDGVCDAVHYPDAVIVDETFVRQLGVERLGDEFEMYGTRCIVRGICRDVRTMTASPFVFTSIAKARAFDKRYRNDQITYVLARCAPGVSPEQVRERIAAAVPHVEALTSREFAIRTMKYWMLETGLGITVVVTAVLGFSVSTVVVSQTLYTITRDNLPKYAMLSALGFAQWKLALAVLVQSITLGMSGWAAGSGLYDQAAAVSATTPIPLQTTPLIFAAITAAFLASCVIASFLSLKAVFRLDPATVFRA